MSHSIICAGVNLVLHPLVLLFQGALQPVKMKGLYLVEPVVALYAFSSFLIYPLVQQYVYRRLWQDLTNTSYPISDDTSRCAAANDSGNHSSYHEVSHYPVDIKEPLNSSR